MKPYELELLYDEMLDDSYDAFKLTNQVSLLPSRVIKKTDPIFYREGYLDFLDSLIKDNMITEKEAENAL